LRAQKGRSLVSSGTIICDIFLKKMLADGYLSFLKMYSICAKYKEISIITDVQKVMLSASHLSNILFYQS